MRNPIVWILILGYLIIILSFVAHKRQNIPCTSMEVVIIDTAKNKFINKNDIKLLIKEKKKQIIGEPIDKIDIANLEHTIESFPTIKKAEIYKTMEGKLIIEVTQKTPIIRIIGKNGFSFYIDKRGKIMPMAKNYSSRVLLANGNIDTETIEKDTLLLSDFSKKTKSNAQIHQLYLLGKFIFQHDFWRSQIEQIYVNEDKEVELVPKIGAHIIYLGEMDKFEYKFFKLESLYKEGLKRVGWNTYKTINLKYSNQVVCEKR